MGKIENWSPDHERGNLKRNWVHDEYPVHVGILHKGTFRESDEEYYRVYFEDSDLIISRTIAEADTLDEAEDAATTWLRNHPLHDYDPSFKHKVEKGSTGHLTDGEKEMVRQEFNWVVIDATDTDMTWSESYMGTGLGSVKDYGRHHDLTEQEFIEKNKEEALKHGAQYLNFQAEDDELADTIVIISKSGGYVRKAAKMQNLKEKGLV